MTRCNNIIKQKHNQLICLEESRNVGHRRKKYNYHRQFSLGNWCIQSKRRRKIKSMVSATVNISLASPAPSLCPYSQYLVPKKTEFAYEGKEKYIFLCTMVSLNLLTVSNNVSIYQLHFHFKTNNKHLCLTTITKYVTKL